MRCLLRRNPRYTSALIVVVVDQTGGVVSDAKVTVVNNATGAAREVTSGDDGSATAPTTNRPVVEGKVIRKSAFQGTGTQDVSVFVEGRLKPAGRTILLRLEGFDLFNHGNILGRAITTYGDTGTPNAAFGAAGDSAKETFPHALPGLANIEIRRECSSCKCGFCSEVRSP